MMRATETSKTVLDVDDLSIGFRGRAGGMLPVLRNITLSVGPGESIGLVGESGSGKSTLALAMMGYLKTGLRVLDGKAHFDGVDMFAQDRGALERIRGGRLGLIPQNSGQSLTPSLRVGAQIREALRLHSSLSEDQYDGRVIDLLGQVRLPDPEAIARRYPHELSGGQQQRVAIAMALAGEPEALLLDEPTTGLDVTTQAHILELLRDLARDTGMAMVYVSHDLGAIARVCDRVVVMYAGEVVLEGASRQVLRDPGHPYARGLLASIPKLSDKCLPRALDGRPPAPGQAGMGCAFVSRCAIASEPCRTGRPELALQPDGTSTRCHLPEQVRSIPLTGERETGVRKLPEALSLTLNDMAISYTQPGLVDWLLGRKTHTVAIVDGIDVALCHGETMGLVGESGSGKSTILKSISGLLPPLRGATTLKDHEKLPAKVEDRDRRHLRQVQLIFQNPDESLNPRQTIAQILAQPLKLYFGLSGQALLARSSELLEQVRLGAHYLDRLPSQLSGGEKQRVAVARAFAAQPELVLCDEITSALDVSVQAAVLELLDDLRRVNETSYIFVSHDLAVVKALSDRVAVLYQGRLCELGPTQEVYGSVSHPYTEVLLGAVLEPDPDYTPSLAASDVVELSPPERGCPFQRRCPKRVGSVCEDTAPPRREFAGGHTIWCHREDLAS
ncbi:dipeptide ABC transporter ATP-binding protein [Roseovarius sp. 2305UL8-3]|uniref:dipeptide ABC transporter ATP-binding protein n=1 Tax=Roseovarius conchicola TaxID=3121636 RepID=UPI0035274932